MYDELVKRIWECASDECFNCSQYTETTNASVCSKELMKQAADAIEELSKPRWIPVEEQLPKEYAEVLVFTRTGNVALDRLESLVAYCIPDFRKFGVGAVTHWMPLPEPPTKGE